MRAAKAARFSTRARDKHTISNAAESSFHASPTPGAGCWQRQGAGVLRPRSGERGFAPQRGLQTSANALKPDLSAGITANEMAAERIHMRRPVAFKLTPDDKAKAFRVRAEPIDASKLNRSKGGPALVVSRKVTILEELATGLVDADDILLVQEGDWNNALLIVVEDIAPAETASVATSKSEHDIGDEAFIAALSNSAPHLIDLGREIIRLIRENGVTGELVENTKGRWVNIPLNSFTLKAQPRVSNIQFTLYGEPKIYDAGDFLLKDQNSYSRGWVKNHADAMKFSGLVKAAHARRLGSPHTR